LVRLALENEETWEILRGQSTPHSIEEYSLLQTNLHRIHMAVNAAIIDFDDTRKIDNLICSSVCGIFSTQRLWMRITLPLRIFNSGFGAILARLSVRVQRIGFVALSRMEPGIPIGFNV
jgi:hypothetical protein